MQEKFKKIFQHFKNLENMFLEIPRNVLIFEKYLSWIAKQNPMSNNNNYDSFEMHTSKEY